MTNLKRTAAALVLCVGCCSIGALADRLQSTGRASAAHVDSIPWGETVLRKADGSVEATYRYRLVEPPKAAIADPGALVPLIVFLHGSGERGSDNTAQLKHIVGWSATEALQSTHPCFVLAMQCPDGETWSPIDIKAARERGETPKFAPEPTRAMRALMQALEEVRQAKAIDQRRIYLTGLSMGGFGAFDLAARRPGLFAAVVPVCGGGDPSTADLVAAVPFYIVHGTDDPVVPVALSRAMRDAIAGSAARAAEPEREHSRAADDAPRPVAGRASVPLYREYDKVGHDSWTPAYRFGDEGVLDWMFAQRRPGASQAKPGQASPQSKL